LFYDCISVFLFIAGVYFVEIKAVFIGIEAGSMEMIVFPVDFHCGSLGISEACIQDFPRLIPDELYYQFILSRVANARFTLCHRVGRAKLFLTNLYAVTWVRWRLTYFLWASAHVIVIHRKKAWMNNIYRVDIGVRCSIWSFMFLSSYGISTIHPSSSSFILHPTPPNLDIYLILNPTPL
jgi:hypothetical protein